MQPTKHEQVQPQRSRGGGRISSPEYRESLTLCEDFQGLEESVERYDLLLLVKRAGKAAGFTSRMIQLLDYYMAFTREIDWHENSRPVVYQSLARTSLDLGVSERQIQKLEQQLFAAGAISWRDSGNHKRYGQRDPRTGEILFAYGVDLTPLAYLRKTLEDKLHEKQLYDRAWLETKRQISWYRRQIRSTILELDWEEGDQIHDLHTFEQAYEKIAVSIRTYMTLEDLRALLEQHKRLHGELVDLAPTIDASKQDLDASKASKISCKSSCTGEPEFVHYKTTTQQSSDKSDTDSPADKGFQESVADRPRRSLAVEKNETGRRGVDNDREALILATGLQHISLKHVLQAASERFRDHLPMHPRPMNWADVVEAAYQLRPELQISQQSWAEACELLGRNGAAVCILLTDRATQRLENQVTKPGAYFRGLVKRGRNGDLRLLNSVVGFGRSHDQNAGFTSEIA